MIASFRPMNFAYADPPYLGLAAKLYGDLHPDAADYDRVETHAALIKRLSSDYGGWAYSLHVPALKEILPVCPDGVRIGAWVKPFASFKPGVNPGYAWEAVIFGGGRKLGRDVRTVRDFVQVPIALKRGLAGAKPEAFCWWVFDFLGMDPLDEFTDIFPGSGSVGRAWDQWKRVHEGFPMIDAGQSERRRG